MRLLLVLPATALVLTGCSGSGDGGAGKAAYVDQASAVCATADAAFAALAQPRAAADFAPFVEETLTIAERAQTGLAALTPPADARADLESRVLVPFAGLVEQGRAFADKVDAAGADQAALLPLLAQRPTSAGVDLDYLRQYGLESCADAISKAG